ncbi:hypothetical protein LSCM1_08218 [Leishmania martiniquensis]|uniref:Uncharacterized protein n=1 Tax=Leishmania martiniquensis TaxID=1580590 RepID=A0A836KUZ9_9TRYP|nr:hypothetical protein LSCM1_08218 [Leishmania martiniquensis]
MPCPFSIAIRVGLALFVVKRLYDAVCSYQQGNASRGVKRNSSGDGKCDPPTASLTSAAKAA